MRAARVAVTITGVLALAGCASSGATTAAASGHQAAATVLVSGQLVMEGGPLGPGGQQPGVRLIPGTVSFTGGHGRTVTAAVPASGRFTVRLPDGTYRAAATTPDISGPGGSPCADPSPVRIAGHPVHVVIACIVP